MKTKLALAAIAIAVAALGKHDARACSCMGPHLTFLSPVGADAAPLNVRVRLAAPTTGLNTSQLVLRVHGGATVATHVQTYAGSWVTTVELVPNAALPATTRFEIATVDPAAHPPTTVIGTFKTGTTADTTAPRLDSIGKPRTRINAQYGGGDCSIHGPWIVLADIVAHDEREGGKLAYGVWRPDGHGRLDTHRLPDAIVFPYNNVVSIGQTSLCDPDRFALDGSAISLAIAAIDESGNTSRALSFRADLTRNTP